MVYGISHKSILYTMPHTAPSPVFGKIQEFAACLLALVFNLGFGFHEDGPLHVGIWVGISDVP